MTSPANIVGNNIRQFRERLGLSQQDLAKYLQTSHANVSYYETGERNIPIHVIESLAALFGVDSYDLYEENPMSQQANTAFAFRANELTEHDLSEIASFKTIVRNYVKMKTILDREN